MPKASDAMSNPFQPMHVSFSPSWRNPMSIISKGSHPRFRSSKNPPPITPAQQSERLLKSTTTFDFFLPGPAPLAARNTGSPSKRRRSAKWSTRFFQNPRIVDGCYLHRLSMREKVSTFRSSKTSRIEALSEPESMARFTSWMTRLSWSFEKNTRSKRLSIASRSVRICRFGSLNPLKQPSN